MVNNLTTAVDGGVLDARQGKELNDALAKLNKLMGSADISGIGNGTVTGALLTLNSNGKISGRLQVLWQDQDSSGRGSGLKIIVDNNTTLFLSYNKFEAIE